MNKENEQVIETLKNLTAYDFIINCIGIKNSDGNSSEVYTAKQLQNMYPKLFSKYKLDQAIKNENLPFFKSGRERYFVKRDIDNWIKNKNMPEV